jgi:hypothetical protein
MFGSNAHRAAVRRASDRLALAGSGAQKWQICALAHPWPERSALLELSGAGVALAAIDHDVGAGDP